MKRFIFPLLCLFLFACGEEKQAPETAETSASEQAPSEEIAVSTPPSSENPAVLDHDPLGMYVGSFEAKKYGAGNAPSYSNLINISINRIEEDKVYGHSVVAGNIRPFEGSLKKVGDTNYMVEAKEPGDDRYDGSFKFSIILGTKPSINGTWVANDTKLAVTERKYELQKRKYDYNPELDLPESVTYDGLYDTWSGDEAETLTSSVTQLNASKALLKKQEVENLYKADLEFIRNAVYARHGYSFKNRRVRYVFDNYVDWYIPISTDIRDQLTEVERENIALLKRYEEHAEEYYDSFGR